MEGTAQPRRVILLRDEPIYQKTKSLRVQAYLSPDHSSFSETNHGETVTKTHLQKDPFHFGNPVPVLPHQDMPLPNSSRLPGERGATVGPRKRFDPDLRKLAVHQLVSHVQSRNLE